MKLYIMRHGQTAWNKARRLQGHSNIELNESGIALAKAVGEKVKDIKFDRIFTSPLKRAKDTAKYVIGKRGIPIIVEEQIKEICFGDWEGRCIKPDQLEVPEKEFKKFIEKPAEYVPPSGGESIEHLCQRTADFVKQLLDNTEYKSETILITTHGAAVRAIMHNLLGNDLNDFWLGKVPPNCSLNIFEIENGEVVSFLQDVTLEQL